MAEAYPSNEDLAIEGYEDQAPKPFKPNRSFFEKIGSPLLKMFEDRKLSSLRREVLTTSTPIIASKREHPPMINNEDTQNKTEKVEAEKWSVRPKQINAPETQTRVHKSEPKLNDSSFTDEDSFSGTPLWLTQAEELIKPNNAELTGLGNSNRNANKATTNNKPQIGDESLPVRQQTFPIVHQKKPVKNSEFLSAMSHIATFSGDETQDAKKFVRNVEEIKEMLELGNDKVLQMLKFKTDKEARTFITTAEVMYEGDANAILGALTQKYEPAANINSLQMKLTSIKMKKGETIRQFKSRIEKINSKIIEINWDAAPTESLLVSIFVKALPKYTRQLLMDSGKQSWDAITARAERLEDETNDDKEPKVTDACTVEKAKETISTEELAIQALGRKTAYQESQATCTNCFKKGHVAYKCPAPRQNRNLDLTGYTPQEAKKVLYFCSYCGSGQHLIEDCPLEKANKLRNPSIYSDRYQPTEEYLQSKQQVICYACGGVGHYANECPTKLKLEYAQQNQGYNSMIPQFNTMFNPRGRGRGRGRGFGNRGNNNNWKNNNNWNNGNGWNNNNNNWNNNSNWNNNNQRWNRGNRRPFRGNNRGRRNPNQQNPNQNQNPPGNQLALPAPPTPTNNNQGN